MAFALGAAAQAVGEERPPRTFEYLYVDANEGGSSGGHVAIRFGDEVYHYQHEEPGVLRLHRDGDQAFLHLYSALQNRNIRAVRVAVSDETYRILRDGFEERRQIEEAHFDRLASAAEDAALFEQLLAERQARWPGAKSEGLQGLALPAVGFFLPDGGDPIAAGPGWPGLHALRTRIARERGPEFLPARKGELARSLAALEPESAERPPVPVSEERLPAASYGFARRYRDGLVALQALEVLERALPLRAASLRTGEGPDWELSQAERERLGELAGELERRLGELVASSRPDFGVPLLVGMARLFALHASASSGHLFVLDAFSDEDPLLPRAALVRNAALLPLLNSENRAAFLAARAALFESAGGLEEARLADLESTGNRWLELEEGARGERDVRLHPGRLVPARPARRTDLPQIAAADLVLRDALGRVVREKTALEHALLEAFRYDLITRNCVTEIFRTIDRSLAETQDDGRSADRALGGHVGVGFNLNFIPFVSASSVEGRWHVLERQELPSRRRALLHALYQREEAIGVYLREANTLTSTLYHHANDDSFFLFFTDDAAALRPLYGAINLASGVAAASVGLLLSPFDGGKVLSAGARGALFSLPELAFFNIRKGTFEFAAEDHSSHGGETKEMSAW
ncbi:MAG TPA: hypothetical protein DEP35_00915 [Deltaproteobacteria bacterium]|jgi:hypothetical protein|nr:hypothetical protein [Deltaproteobacteria bacterium]